LEVDDPMLCALKHWGVLALRFLISESFLRHCKSATPVTSMSATAHNGTATVPHRHTWVLPYRNQAQISEVSVEAPTTKYIPHTSHPTSLQYE
jgi:hypothetical protein